MERSVIRPRRESLRNTLEPILRAHHSQIAEARLAVIQALHALDDLSPDPLRSLAEIRRWRREIGETEALRTARQQLSEAKERMDAAALGAIPAFPLLKTDDLAWLARSTVIAGMVRFRAIQQLEARGESKPKSDFEMSVSSWVRRQQLAKGQVDSYKPRYGDGCRLE